MEFEEEQHYTRESTWGRNDGKEIAIKDLEDRHLVNIVHFLTHSERHKRWLKRAEYLRVLKEEIKLRKLSKEFVAQAPYPFRDEEDGKLKTWSFEKNCIVEVPLSIELILDCDKDAASKSI
jgi:hypothetical protein